MDVMWNGEQEGRGSRVDTSMVVMQKGEPEVRGSRRYVVVVVADAEHVDVQDRWVGMQQNPTAPAVLW